MQITELNELILNIRKLQLQQKKKKTPIMELPLNPSTIETKTNANDRIEQLILKILKWQFLNLNQTPI